MTGDILKQRPFKNFQYKTTSQLGVVPGQPSVQTSRGSL